RSNCVKLSPSVVAANGHLPGGVNLLSSLFFRLLAMPSSSLYSAQISLIRARTSGFSSGDMSPFWNCAILTEFTRVGEGCVNGARAAPPWGNRRTGLTSMTSSVSKRLLERQRACAIVSTLSRRTSTCAAIVQRPEPEDVNQCAAIVQRRVSREVCYDCSTGQRRQPLCCDVQRLSRRTSTGVLRLFKRLSAEDVNRVLAIVQRLRPEDVKTAVLRLFNGLSRRTSTVCCDCQRLAIVQRLSRGAGDGRRTLFSSNAQRRSSSGVTAFLAFSCFSAFLGAVCFGWSTGVINNPKASIVRLINESTAAHYGVQLTAYTADVLFSVVVSMFAVGGMIGALVSGYWAERLGRRNGMLVNSGVGVVAALLMSPAGSFEMLIIGRLLIGFCSALYTGLVPIYLAEIAPRQLRGGIGVLNQLGVVTGLLLSQALSIQQALGGPQLWPILFAIAGLPSILQLACLPACLETPRHLLLTRHDEAAARSALCQLRARRQRRQRGQVHRRGVGGDSLRVWTAK
uniref:MFS domain-containing protein n=1 Tax=Macrostomum lignano TaxID=282301 RepID=A0A1I8FE25_9PLAT